MSHLLPCSRRSGPTAACERRSACYRSACSLLAFLPQQRRHGGKQTVCDFEPKHRRSRRVPKPLLAPLLSAHISGEDGPSQPVLIIDGHTTFTVLTSIDFFQRLLAGAETMMAALRIHRADGFVAVFLE
ncbi:hypothetical protein ILYODFUR_000819 [Ilyodon furcidens]|uniref:Uncharacterized protein n=1 Tax=Ilyodon furcidens TaxID=33524 RepID=A0ABV0TQU8_9TELE